MSQSPAKSTGDPVQDWIDGLQFVEARSLQVSIVLCQEMRNRRLVSEDVAMPSLLGVSWATSGLISYRELYLHFAQVMVLLCEEARNSARLATNLVYWGERC